jgi:hypothetical protein
MNIFLISPRGMKIPKNAMGGGDVEENLEKHGWYSHLTMSHIRNESVRSTRDRRRGTSLDG